MTGTAPGLHHRLLLLQRHVQLLPRWRQRPLGEGRGGVGAPWRHSCHRHCCCCSCLATPPCRADTPSSQRMLQGWQLPGRLPPPADRETAASDDLPLVCCCCRPAGSGRAWEATPYRWCRTREGRIGGLTTLAEPKPTGRPSAQQATEPSSSWAKRAGSRRGLAAPEARAGGS